MSKETKQELPPCKWNKDVVGAWRMDINVDIIEDTNIEKNESICDVQGDLDVNSINSESEAKSSVLETNGNNSSN